MTRDLTDLGGEDLHAVSVIAAAALLFTPDGRYLMQLRDDFPQVLMRNHWGLFGGIVEAGETPAQALRRELEEELAFAVEALAEPFTHLVYDLRFAGRGLHRKFFFEVPIAQNQLAMFRLGEGQAMRLFKPNQLLLQERVSPWDWYGVVLHARRARVIDALSVPAAQTPPDP